MSIYYLFDDSLRENSKYYSFTYIAEVLSRLGVSGTRLSSDHLSAFEFSENDVLFLGNYRITDSSKKSIKIALENGLTLIGFGTQNADDLFGVTVNATFAQPNDEFTLNGYFSADAEWLAVPENKPALPVFSSFRAISPGNCDVIGRITHDGNVYPAFTKHHNAFYFAADIIKTMLIGSQGKPVYNGTQWFPASRMPDARVVPLDYDTTVAFCDYYMYILEKILSEKGVVMVHRLPPFKDGEIPDLLLFYAGDDDAVSKEVSLKASEIMASRSLPYHINLMPKGEDGGFAISKKEYDIIRSRGHELALHYDVTGSFAVFSEESFKKQIEMYVNAFGELPVCNISHCFVHCGWAEHARYQAKFGIKGDNGRSGEFNPDDINAFNVYGFGFGTCYPFFIYDDTAHGNTKIDFCDLPVTYYEPRLGKDFTDSTEKIEKCIDSAAYFGRTINLFTHPHYLAGYQGYDSDMTLRAIDFANAYGKEQGYRILNCGPDELCLWWHERDQSKVSDAQSHGSGLTFSVSVSGGKGVIVKIPVNGKSVSSLTLDGQKIPVTVKKIDGILWALASVLTSGRHTVAVVFD